MRARTRSTRASPSPTTGSKPRAPTTGTDGPSATFVMLHAGAPVWVSSRSNGRCRLGKPPSAPTSAPQVLDSEAARSASSAMRSAARSRMRRGSTRRIWASSPSRSKSTCSPSASHGSHDSMPSKTSPSARRSHCSRPHGSVPTRAAARAVTSGVNSTSRHGKISTLATSPLLRWSLMLKSLRRSTSSPHRSMRTGPSAVDG